jgi:hypothetical protein
MEDIGNRGGKFEGTSGMKLLEFPIRDRTQNMQLHDYADS